MSNVIVLGSLRLEGFPHNDGVSVVVTTQLGPQELRMSIGDWARLQRLVDVLAAADRQHEADRAEIGRLDVAMAKAHGLLKALDESGGLGAFRHQQILRLIGCDHRFMRAGDADCRLCGLTRVEIGAKP